ncbi:cupin domain-containing protein [Aestuariibacter salexigens]|uniref:cupin domain-containing protein n=1 Tax=Aestuariibacter salexigens TaxID=226010 RepID=UPI00041CA2F7|nr:cupin domain-containing protein [Aestuariibacter salexigens]
MSYQLINFDRAEFMRKYWQKKPAVFRQVFDQFSDPLDEHELADLAMEQDIDSRIVSRDGDKWAVHEGPFCEFDSVCQHHWSLLVQSVDHHHTSADALLRAFCFVPNWRIDNLMVSFSVAGAGVGAHIDQYDVFIIQGKGSRRWQVGLPGDYPPYSPHPSLSLIDGFEPVIDEELHPGDMVYIPPGHPHQGQSSSDCLNYSVGFRGPTGKELLTSFSEETEQYNWFTERISDPTRQCQPLADEISQQDISELRKKFHTMIDSDQFLLWFGQHSARRLEDWMLEELEEDGRTDDKIVPPDSLLIRQPGIHPIFIPANAFSDRIARVFVEDVSFNVPDAECELVREFLNAPQFTINSKKSHQNSLFFNRFVATLVNRGFWHQHSSL